MAKPKSLILRVEIDQTINAHNCQHNRSHRLVRGDRRLKVWNDRSFDHYCKACALQMVENGIERLREVARALEADEVKESEVS